MASESGYFSCSMHSNPLKAVAACDLKYCCYGVRRLVTDWTSFVEASDWMFLLEQDKPEGAVEWVVVFHVGVGVDVFCGQKVR